MRFADVIGQEKIKEMLAAGVSRGRVPHAQIFSGEPGYGTLPLALAYASFLNCQHPTPADSCGKCSSCLKISELAHPDLHFVFPVPSTKSASGHKSGSDNFISEWREMVVSTKGYFDEQQWYEHIGMDNQQGLISRSEADEIIRKLSYKAFEGNYKIVIIWLPEKMRAEAANALLKMLEEPWEKTVFLMVSRNPSLLLPTIISRTQQLTVPGIEHEELERYYTEKISGPGDPAVTRLAAGDLIELARLEGGGSGESARFFEMFTSLMRFSYNDRHMELLDWADQAASLGRESQKRLMQYSIGLLRENYILHAGMDNISYLSGEELQFCRKFSPFIDNGNVEKLVEEMEKVLLHISGNGNPRIIFSHFALTVSKLINRK